MGSPPREAVAVAEALGRASSVLIASHRGMDGDSAGSSLSIRRALRARGGRAEVVNAEPPPPYLDFLPGIDEVRRPAEVSGPFDLALVLDTSDAHLLGEEVSPLLDGRRVVVVDHHIQRAPWGDVSYVDVTAAAVCEQAYEVLRALGAEIDAEAATLLYTGLVTDTGSFHQANTTPRTHEVAAECLRAGARPFDVARNLFERTSEARARLLGKALSTFRYAAGGRIVYAVLSRADFAAAGAADAETEGIIHHLRALDGIEIAVLLRETASGDVKANFRSKDGADVAAVARAFGGGGHKAAAGATVAGRSLDEAVREVVAAAERALAAPARR